jgi:hypothetical protein
LFGFGRLEARAQTTTVTAPFTPVETITSPVSNETIPYVSSSSSTPSTTSTSGTTSGTTTSVSCSSTGIGKIICQFQQILNSIVPVLVAFGVVVFIWGVVLYVIADGEEAKKKGKDRMIYGIIGFAVIIGLWGFVNIIVNTFGLSATAPGGLNVNGAAGSSCSVGTTFQTFVGFITCVIDSSIIPLIFTIAVVMFIWGVVQYFIINADEEAKRAQGKQFMIWGVIALAVMLSVWGLVGILGTTFNVSSSVLPHVTPTGSSQ